MTKRGVFVQTLSSEFKEEHPEYYDDSGACSLFKNGQEFIVDNIGVISKMLSPVPPHQDRAGLMNQAPTLAYLILA